MKNSYTEKTSLSTEKPGPPTYPFTMTEFSKTSLTLTWGPSHTDGGSAILHYILEKRESWKSTFQHVTKVKPEGQGQKLTHCVEGLKEDQDYMFRVFAENSVGASKAIETDVPYKPRSPFSKYWIKVIDLKQKCILMKKLFLMMRPIFLCWK